MSWHTTEQRRQASAQRAVWVRHYGRRLTTADLWRELRQDPVLQVHVGAAVYVGADDTLTSAIKDAEEAYKAAINAGMNIAFLPAEIVRDKFIASSVQFMKLATQAQMAGAASTAASATLLGQGMGQAAANVGTGVGQGAQAYGQGLGEGLKGALGGSPKDFADLWAVVAVLLGAGLFLTPGGQALIPAIGKGIGAGVTAAAKGAV